MGLFRRPLRIHPLPHHNNSGHLQQRLPPRELLALRPKRSHLRANPPAQRLQYRMGFLFAGLIIVCFGSFLTQTPRISAVSEFQERPHRSLLNSGADWESCDYELAQRQNAGWVILYIVCIVHLFAGVAILCDGYFVDSLETISEVLDLSPDVAGATFMAAGSSAPELFTSLAGVSVQSDVGVGTIVGSAVFNILVIIALSAAVAGEDLAVDWKIFTRDAIHYGLSIIMFIIFSWDGYFTWWEAIVLIILYVVYVLNMVVNESIMKAVVRWTSKVGSFDGDEIERNEKACERDPLTLNTQTTTTPTTTTPTATAPTMATNDLHAIDTEATEDPPRDRRPSQVERFGLELALQDESGDARKIVRSSSFGAEDFQQMIRQSSQSSFRRQKQFKSEINLSNGAEETGATPVDLPSHFMRNHDGKFSSILLRGPQGLRDASGQHHGSNHSHHFIHQLSSLPAVKSYRSSPLMSRRMEAPSDTKMTSGDSHEDSAQATPETQSISEQPLVGDGDSNSDSEDDSTPTCQERCKHPCCIGTPCVEVDPEKYLIGSARRGLKLTMEWCKFVVTAPYDWLFMNTIPPAKYYKASFTMSIFWIMVLSFAMVTAVIRLGCIVGIDDYVMGLVIVAAGTSVPDALTSMAVAKGGFSDMSVSNALGSNVFDINLGLGIPMLLSNIIHWKPMDLLTTPDRKAYGNGSLVVVDHVKFGLILLGILSVTSIAFKLVHFKLNRRLGITFACMYVLFVTYALVQELQCKRKGFVC